MKKISLLLAVILSVSFIFTGCAAKKNNVVKTITLWNYYNADIKTNFDNLVRTFNETVGKEKGIIVDSYSLGGVNELADAVYAAANKDIGSKEMPNIFSAYSDNALRIDELGAIAPLDDYFTADELALYRKEFIEDGRFSKDGSLKIIPVAKSTELSFLNLSAYNKFADETGAELSQLETWEGIVDTAQKYYEWSGGKAFFGIDSMANFMIIAAKQLGDDIFKESGGKVSLNLSRENAKKIWDTFYVPYMKGYFTAVGRFRSDDVKSGNIIMFLGSNSSATFFPKIIETGKDTSYKTKPLVMPYPYFSGKKPYCIQQGAGMVVAKSDVETEKACVEFLKWFTAPEQNAPFAAKTSYLPVQNSVLSYDSAIKLLSTTDENDVILQANQAAYKMLDSYSLYAVKPLKNSFNARAVLETSLLKQAQSNFAAMNEKLAAGGDKATLLLEYCSDESFSSWYKSLNDEINAL
ncbi:MAG: extracellular solute-binding protein [Hydrogenoanaerobacterium sp.]